MIFCHIDPEALRIIHFYQADAPLNDGDIEIQEKVTPDVLNFMELVRDPETGVISLVENTQKKTDQSWTALRTQRNQLLQQSDWTQLQDAHLSAEKKSAWADYRQALRDLPDETTNPLEAEWPTSPK